ncbi:dienelactone hydrolase family protein [Bacteriovorax sp. PP10]|uniref:Dienelactone hydrolase family protein n=1 Tax=Bacteriovorax antarcticus TaxID=3088717 RepID=A0ABU5VSZ1_9BACT|nr:dienelactone hydrolase family protein [Bacteriovorax sp. PP10]MEA9356163.1 dienelactone hydrolase family protein [Bacteriovorax sp. PP10]
MIKVLILSLLFTVTAQAKVKTEKVEYKSGDLTFEGFLAYDTLSQGKKPGIMVVHNWMGITAETESKVMEMAKLGYVVMAGDIYGKGIRPKDAAEAGALAGKYKADLKTLRERANLAIDELKKQKKVDTSKIFVVGYCFGGTTAIEVARSGTDLRGVITFHGGLTPSNDDKNIKGPLLVLHGAVDPFVPKADFDGFVKGMNDAKIDYQLVSYANAVHSFTEKGAGNDNSKGAAYNELADKRSWIAMKDFLAERSK